MEFVAIHDVPTTLAFVLRRGGPTTLAQSLCTVPVLTPVDPAPGHNYCCIPPRFTFAEVHGLSIYRKFEAMRLPSNDVHARIGAAATRPAGPVAVPDGPKPEQRRKAMPANTPLPRTLKWVESLPSDVKPTALLRHYARIANVLAAAWEDPKAVNSYMDCLLGDERGDRKGFPHDVSLELLGLREYHVKLHGEQPLTWSIHRKRG